MTAVWQRGWFWLLLALVSTLPFIIAPLPMMPDYFSHTARYHVMNHGAASSFLPRYYSFHWALIGNLGIDLLMVPLGHLMPTETAARIAAGLIPPLTIAGIHAVSRAAWGRIEAPALLALPLIYSFSFLYGFVNFHLALALALLVLALWIHSAAMPPWRRWLVFAPLGFMVWVAHMAGWGVLLVAVGCHELVTARRHGRGLAAAARLLPLAIPLLPILLWRSTAPASPIAPEWSHKFLWLFTLMRGEWRGLDIAMLYVLIIAAIAVARMRGARHRPTLLLAAAAMSICFLALPDIVFGSYYADQRLLAPAAMLFFLGCAMPPGRRANAIAGIGIALFGLRIAETGIGWHQRGQAAVADLQALDQVPRGARIAVATLPSGCGEWRLAGYDHLPSLAIVRREAFVDTEWDLAGAQLMRPIYNTGRGANNEGDVLISAPGCPLPRTLPALLAALPRDRFDYVWVFGDTQPLVPWLHIVHRGPHGRLYRIAS